MQRMPPRPLETPIQAYEWHGLATGLVFVDMTSMEEDVGPEVVGKQIQWTENIDNSFFFYLPLMFLPIKLICANFCTDSVVVCLLYLTLQQLHELWKQSDRVSRVFCRQRVIWQRPGIPLNVWICCFMDPIFFSLSYRNASMADNKINLCDNGKDGEVRISLSMEVAHSKSNNLIYNSTKTFLGT